MSTPPSQNPREPARSDEVTPMRTYRLWIDDGNVQSVHGDGYAFDAPADATDDEIRAIAEEEFFEHVSYGWTEEEA